jgi:bifunctional DNA-binding transcriptional regulator/antitoxin component of YhaV-PrlF toxin-antitoxin module
MRKVRKTRRRGRTRITTKNQVTLPVDALRAAGLEAGEEVSVESDGPGRITILRADDVIARYAGTLSYPAGYLEELRNEWDA